MVEATALLSTEECSGILVRALRCSSIGHRSNGRENDHLPGVPLALKVHFSKRATR